MRVVTFDEVGVPTSQISSCVHRAVASSCPSRSRDDGVKQERRSRSSAAYSAYSPPLPSNEDHPPVIAACTLALARAFREEFTGYATFVLHLLTYPRENQEIVLILVWHCRAYAVLHSRRGLHSRVCSSHSISRKSYHIPGTRSTWYLVHVCTKYYLSLIHI